MTASLSLERDWINLADIDDIDEVIAGLGEMEQRTKESEGGLVWFFGTSPDLSGLSLAVGVRGELGALHWCDDENAYVPVSGLNPSSKDYNTWGAHHFVVPSSAEVPIEVAYAALREFVATRRRPTCVDWKLDES